MVQWRAAFALACTIAAHSVAPTSAVAQDAAAASAADACGAAAFAAAEPEGHAFDSFEIVVPPGLSPTQVTQRMVAEIQAGSQRAAAVLRGYDAVRRCRSPRWTIAALERQARTYDTLEHAIFAASQSLQPPELGERVAATIAPQLEPIRCLSTVRRVLAVREAQVALAATPAIAIDRAAAEAASAALARIPAADVARCVDDARRAESSIAPFTLHDMAPLPPRR